MKGIFEGEVKMMQRKESKYDKRIREEIANHLIRAFAFDEINFAWVYSVPTVTLIDELTKKYIDALDIQEKYNGWDHPFDFLRGEIRFKYGTTYIANIIYEIANFYEFMYTRCLKCSERTPRQYCDMEPSDIRKCIEYVDNKFWADAAAISWE
jgi:hypothetical protein